MPLTDADILNIIQRTRSSLFDDSRYVVMGGGALYGVMYIGVLQQLCSHCPRTYAKWVQGLRGVAGTSAGAIVALLVAAGKTPWEMRNIILQCGLSRIMRGMLDLQPADMVKAGALTSGMDVDAVCQDLVAMVTGSATTTLAQFAAVTGGRRFVVVVTNLRTQTPEFWDHLTEPDMPLWLAVRATSSLPLIFPVVELGDGRQVYDGGVTCNVPTTLFPAHQTLILLIQNYTAPEKPLPSLWLNVVNTLMEAAQCAALRQLPPAYMRTVPCPFPARPPPLGRLGFHAGKDTIDALVADGALAVAGVYARDVCMVVMAVRAVLLLLRATQRRQGLHCPCPADPSPAGPGTRATAGLGSPGTPACRQAPGGPPGL